MEDKQNAFYVNIPDPDGEIRRKLTEISEVERRKLGAEVAVLIEREYNRLVEAQSVINPKLHPEPIQS